MDDRLETLEKKIDKLTEVVVTLARVEERVAQIIEENRSVRTRMKDFSNQVNTLEKEVASRRYMERFIWLIITICVAGYFGGKYFLGK